MNDETSQAEESTRKIEQSSPYVNSAAQDLSGTTIGGYRLVRKIAEGGMGIVYEAIQLKLDRKVALKILTDQLASLPEFLRRFEREAKAAAALNHPNIVQVHDFGEADGRHYLIMEFVDGEDLADYTEKNGKLSIKEALDVIEQAAQGLKAAFEKSIIHRDIKPANLMRTRDGRVKVSDLGLAKVLTEVSDATLSGIGIGSPYYIAPEQADNARHVDHRVDIYALGITLLFLLTGKRPYDGNTPFSIILAHVNKPLPSGMELGTELPDEVEAFIQRLSAKNPDERYQNYDSLLADLQCVKAGFAPALKLPRRKRGIPKLATGAAAILLVAITAVAFLWNRSNKAENKNATLAPTSQSNPNDDARLASQSRGAPTRGGPDSFGHPPEDFREGEFDGRRGPPPGAERGGASSMLPMEPPPRLTRNPLTDGPVKTMLAEADAYALQNKEEYPQIINRYRQVAEKAADTADAPAIQQKINDWVFKHQRASAEAIKLYKGKMQEKIRAGNPQAAWSVWKDFPANLRTREVDDEIRNLLETIPQNPKSNP